MLRCRSLWRFWTTRSSNCFWERDVTKMSSRRRRVPVEAQILERRLHFYNNASRLSSGSSLVKRILVQELITATLTSWDLRSGRTRKTTYFSTAL